MGLGRMIAAAALASTMLAGVARAESFSLEQAISFPFVDELTAAPKADRIAWVRIEHGRAQCVGGRCARFRAPAGDPIQGR